MAAYWKGLPLGIGGGFSADDMVHGAVLNFVASHAQVIGPAISYAIGQGQL